MVFLHLRVFLFPLYSWSWFSPATKFAVGCSFLLALEKCCDSSSDLDGFRWEVCYHSVSVPLWMMHKLSPAPFKSLLMIMFCLRCPSVYPVWCLFNFLDMSILYFKIWEVYSYHLNTQFHFSFASGIPMIWMLALLFLSHRSPRLLIFFFFLSLFCPFFRIRKSYWSVL